MRPDFAILRSKEIMIDLIRFDRTSVLSSAGNLLIGNSETLQEHGKADAEQDTEAIKLGRELHCMAKHAIIFPAIILDALRMLQKQVKTLETLKALKP